MKLSKSEQKVLLVVDDTMWIAQLARAANITHSNTVLLCKKLLKRNLIFFKKDKNKKIMCITLEGRSIKDLLLKLKNK